MVHCCLSISMRIGNILTYIKSLVCLDVVIGVFKKSYTYFVYYLHVAYVQ